MKTTRARFSVSLRRRSSIVLEFSSRPALSLPDLPLSSAPPVARAALACAAQGSRACQVGVHDGARPHVLARGATAYRRGVGERRRGLAHAYAFPRHRGHVTVARFARSGHRRTSGDRRRHIRRRQAAHHVSLGGVHAPFSFLFLLLLYFPERQPGRRWRCRRRQRQQLLRGTSLLSVVHTSGHDMRERGVVYRCADVRTHTQAVAAGVCVCCSVYIYIPCRPQKRWWRDMGALCDPLPPRMQRNIHKRSRRFVYARVLFV